MLGNKRMLLDSLKSRLSQGRSCYKTWIYQRTLRKRFQNEFNYFVAHSAQFESRFKVSWEDRYPILDEHTSTTGFDRHYVYHTAWAAQALAQTRPVEHIDISSSLYFCSIISAFIPVQFYDYRPAELDLPNLKAGQADLTKMYFPDRSIRSLSCMHVVEHIGLGRYGDRIDPEGDLKAMKELQRVVAKDGNLLFVVPVGYEPKICFNAHRIYQPEQVIEAFDEMELKEFTLIPESSQDGGLVINPTLELLQNQKYGCGCFWFVKH